MDSENTAPNRVVLIVDDDPGIRKLLRHWLEQWQFPVRSAASAADALALMTADPAAIVLCDIRMPGRDGLWLMRQIKEGWPQTVLIATSGVSDLDVVVEVRELGVAAYVTKPVGRESLRQALERAGATSA